MRERRGISPVRVQGRKGEREPMPVMGGGYLGKGHIEGEEAKLPWDNQRNQDTPLT